jgi:Family of unknown function (DUF6459)
MTSTLIAVPADPDRRIATHARIRVSRPPRHDPPFDDERPLPGLPTAIIGGNSIGGGLPGDSSAGPVSHTKSGTQPEDRSRSGVAAGGSGRAALAYVRLCIEVLNGYRSPSHLRRMSGQVEFDDVIEQIRHRHNGRGHFRNQAPATVAHAVNQRSVAAGRSRTGVVADPRPMPNRAAPERYAAPTFSLIRLRVSEPVDGVAEVVAVLSKGDASLAVALRLERRNGTWICTVVQVI